MVIVSAAGNYRIVARFADNRVELTLEKLEGHKWGPTEGTQIMTLGIDAMQIFMNGADEAWGDDWR